MLSKCANPACTASFRYLHEGRIFTLMFAPDSSRPSTVWDHAAGRPVERYWLCAACSQTMTVCRVNDHAVVRPLPPQSRVRSHSGIAA